MNASGHTTPPHQADPVVPTEPGPLAEADTQVVRDILTRVCPALGSDSTKMEVAVGKGVKRSPSGRIIELDIFDALESVWDLPRQIWHIPPEITKLHCLEKLDLFLCSSIPPELALMETLEMLAIRYLFHPLVLPAVDFPNVKLFNVAGVPTTAIPDATLALLSQWIGRRLINLNHFGLCLSHELLHTCFSEFAFMGAELGCRDSLDSVCITKCEMTETDLSFFLQCIMPHLSEISTISARYNNIDSLQTLSREVARANTKSTLQAVYLDGNPMVKKIIKSRTSPDDAEDMALLSLLKHFPKLVDFFWRETEVGEGADRPPYASSKVETFIRHRLTGVHDLFGTTHVAPHDTGPQIQHPLPMGSWPLALCQSYQRSDSAKHFDQQKDASGTFYLLRHGPALIGRTHLFKGIDRQSNKRTGSPPLQDQPRRSCRRRKQTTFYGSA